MSESHLDEELKIKKLKEEEYFEPVKKSKRPYTAVLVLITGLILFLCVTVLFGATRIRELSSSTVASTSEQPVLIVQKATDTPSPLAQNAFGLDVAALSAQITPNTLSTVSFEIDYSPAETNLCSGRFEITDMSQLQLLHEESFSDEKDSAVKGIWLGLAAADGDQTDHTIGELTPVYDGQTGQTKFNLVNEPHFRRIANRLTDGANDWVVLTTDYLNQYDHKSGGSALGIPESKFFSTESDLQGHSIKLITRSIDSLIIQPSYYSFAVTWGFWEAKEPNDNHWLHITPTSGNLRPGEKQTILVEFSSSELSKGTYSTELLVDYGENCSQPTIIPVTLSIESN